MSSKLSESAKLRLIRQGQKHIESLTNRLVTCDLKDYDKVNKALQEEKAAVNKLMNNNSTN